MVGFSFLNSNQTQAFDHHFFVQGVEIDFLELVKVMECLVKGKDISMAK